jgi:hypothetical protein
MKNETRWKILNLYKNHKAIYFWVTVAILFLCCVSGTYFFVHFLSPPPVVAVIFSILFSIISFPWIAILTAAFDFWLEQKLQGPSTDKWIKCKNCDFLTYHLHKKCDFCEKDPHVNEPLVEIMRLWEKIDSLKKENERLKNKANSYAY